MALLARLACAGALVAGAAVAHAAPVSGQGTWETTLKARDINGNAVALYDASAAFFYDEALQITWLANFNAGAGSSFDDGVNTTDGRMTWDNAVAWAAGLTTGGFTDWRLPAVIDSGESGCQFSYDGGTDCGYNVQTQVDSAYSEWAHLWYVTLGNLAVCAPGGDTPTTCEELQTGWGLTNTAYFKNMQSFVYWSGTVYESPSSGYVWYFDTVVGIQTSSDESVGLYAVAVRSGDVLRDGGTVPEPQSLALALTALAGLGLALRRRRAA